MKLLILLLIFKCFASQCIDTGCNVRIVAIVPSQEELLKFINCSLSYFSSSRSQFIYSYFSGLSLTNYKTFLQNTKELRAHYDVVKVIQGAVSQFNNENEKKLVFKDSSTKKVTNEFQIPDLELDLEEPKCHEERMDMFDSLLRLNKDDFPGNLSLKLPKIFWMFRQCAFNSDMFMALLIRQNLNEVFEIFKRQEGKHIPFDFSALKDKSMAFFENGEYTSSVLNAKNAEIQQCNKKNSLASIQKILGLNFFGILDWNQVEKLQHRCISQVLNQKVKFGDTWLIYSDFFDLFPKIKELISQLQGGFYTFCIGNVYIFHTNYEPIMIQNCFFNSFLMDLKKTIQALHPEYYFYYADGPLNLVDFARDYEFENKVELKYYFELNQSLSSWDMKKVPEFTDPEMLADFFKNAILLSRLRQFEFPIGFFKGTDEKKVFEILEKSLKDYDCILSGKFQCAFKEIKELQEYEDFYVSKNVKKVTSPK